VARRRSSRPPPATSPRAARRRGRRGLSRSSSSSPRGGAAWTCRGWSGRGRIVPLARPLPPRPEQRPRRWRRAWACSRTSGPRSPSSSARALRVPRPTSIRGCSWRCCDQVEQAEPGGLRHHELLDREPSCRPCWRCWARGPDHAQRRRGAAAHRAEQPREGGALDPGTGPALRRHQEGRARRVHVHRGHGVLRAGVSAGGGLRPHRGRGLLRRRLHGLPRPHRRRCEDEPAPRRRVWLRHGLLRRRALLLRALLEVDGVLLTRRVFGSSARLVSFDRELSGCRDR
jgi:hypothetical protein